MKYLIQKSLLLFFLFIVILEGKPRARDLGIPFVGTPGPLNAIRSAKGGVVEEAIINALIAAKTMEGINNNKVYSLPHDRLQSIMKKYNR